MPARLHLVAFVTVVFFLVPQAAAQRGVFMVPSGEDSLALRTTRGVELTRQRENLAWSKTVAALTDLRLTASWKSDWDQVGGEAERRRQDGRWHLSGRHRWKPDVAFWLATQGEFFDDRRPQPDEPVSPPHEVVPEDWRTATSLLPAYGISPTTIRILRAAGGVQMQPISHTELVGGWGVIEDRRFGHVSPGPLWEATGKVTDWDVSGYLQTLTLEASGENPGCHRNRDLHARYEARREFAPGTDNRAEVSASEVRRSYYLDPSSRLATRKETRARFADRLTYAMRPDLALEIDGELLNAKTEIAQETRTSSLKEARAVLNARLVRRARRLSGNLDVGVQGITQTIDGDILQGRQTDVSLGVGYRATRRDSLFGAFEVSKYQLDTRSPQNNDDRDELRFAFSAGGVGAWSPSLGWEAWARVALDHLVYLFKERSANNHWTRFILLGSRLRHRPTSAFAQTFAFEVSANYQAFDFEPDPRQVRSTVFRKLVAGDSLALALGRAFSVVLRFTFQREELGRLFWHEFQEERSDEVTAFHSTLEVPWRIGRQTEIALGGLWNHRRGIRFPSTEFDVKETFQDLQTYGPLWRLYHRFRTDWTVNGGGQVVRQLELGRQDRWLVMGEIGVAVRW